MRLIDADALMMHLADISLTNSPNDNDRLYERDRKLAVLDGLGMAEEAIREAPTIELLNAQEARVLTFQEVDELAHRLEETPLYYERRGACGTLVSMKTGEPLKNVGRGGLFGAIAGDAQGNTPNLSMIGNVTNFINEYGVTWRCWSSKPTDEQMEGTPWEK